MTKPKTAPKKKAAPARASKPAPLRKPKRGPTSRLQPTPEMAVRMKDFGTVMCTVREVAGCLGCDEASLLRFWAACPEMRAIYEQAMDDGKQSLRRAQFKNALEGNATMQIWLGKQLLGQRDQIDQTRTTKVDLSGLTMEQLDALETLLRAAGSNPAGPADTGGRAGGQAPSAVRH